MAVPPEEDPSHADEYRLGRSCCRGSAARRLHARAILTLLGVLLLAGHGRAASLTIDPAQSTLAVLVYRDGVAARLGHDHVIVARQFSGTVTHDPANPGASSIDIEVTAGALAADDPGTRRRFGLPGELSMSDVADIEKAMKSEGQLDAARFPWIQFKSTTISLRGEGEYLVTGRLTIRGVTNEYAFPARVTVEGEILRARAQLT